MPHRLAQEYPASDFADNGLIPLPENVTAEQGVMLSDILPTGYEIGVRDGGVKEGDVVAVVGAGPVGLSAIMTAASSGAAKVIAVDTNEYRLERAQEFGATDTVISDADAVAKLKELSRGGLGVDVAIEAVGIPATLTLALDALRPGGTVANVGVHGAPFEFPIQDKWIENITMTMGLVNATTAPDLLDDIKDGKIQPEKFVTHRFTFAEWEKAYDVFSRAAEEEAIKVIVTAE